MACYIDANRLGKQKGEIHPTCVLDEKKPEDCTFAGFLVELGIWDKTRCKLWIVTDPVKLTGKTK